MVGLVSSCDMRMERMEDKEVCLVTFRANIS